MGLEIPWFHILRGGVAGAVAAAAVDFSAFKRFQTFDEVKRYDWKLAAVRVAQGAVLGILSSLGLGQLL